MRALAALGREISDQVEASQVHGREVVVVTAAHRGQKIRGADGLTSRDPSAVLAMHSADCVPVLMADPVTRAVAAVHAGWRGTAAGAAAAAVRAMGEAFGSQPADLVAAIGPAIGPCCYEVGGDVVEALAPWHWRRSVLRSVSKGRWLLDLWMANRLQIEAAGVPPGAITTSGLCTACHPALFFSHRRSGRAGRMAALIATPDRRDSPPPDEYRRGVTGMEERYRAVVERISHAAERVGRDPASVTLIGVTKGVGAERVREAVAAGLRDLGENRVQEAVPKIEAVGPGPRWHMIGHLQRNKAGLAVGHFQVIHSLDSLRIAEAVDRAAGEAGRRVPVLIEVNVAGEATKYGLAPDAVVDLLRRVHACRFLDPIGLMTVAPLAGDPETVRPVFRELRVLRDRLRADVAHEGFRHLSMGMSGDFEVAIEEGATIVRVGRAIFGDR